MKTHSNTIALVTMILLIGCLSACATPAPTATPVPTATPTPLPPGTITGEVMYKPLTKRADAEPMPNVVIALCRVPAEGLPEGPPVSLSNKDESEKICTLQEVPTALTDAQGSFTLDGVPPGTYVVMFHLFPDMLGAGGTEWDGIVLMEASLDETNSIPASGQSDFWERGGPAIALGNWSQGVGMTVSEGNVCSDALGFCFSIHEEHLATVVEVRSHETVEVQLTAHLKPEE